jgi:ankyrin repeat protein
MQNLKFYFSLLVLAVSMAYGIRAFADEPLLMAMKKNDHIVIDSLLNKSHNPNVVGSQGETPLMIAAVRSDYDLAKTLIDAGAKITYADNKNRTALWFAAFKSDKAMMQLFLKQPGVETIINKQDFDTKNSALHFAVGVATCDLDLLKLFVHMGADIRLKNIFGQTPAAVCSADKNCSEICKKAGIE